MPHPDEVRDNPDERETCTAHNRPKPCRECKLATLEFNAECKREERMERNER